jgi:hypothetical protein
MLALGLLLLRGEERELLLQLGVLLLHSLKPKSP